MRHLRDFSGSRNEGMIDAVSDLAFTIGGPDASLAHDGINPHRISDIARRGSVAFWRITGTG
jgi:hypothetical protein